MRSTPKKSVVSLKEKLMFIFPYLLLIFSILGFLFQLILFHSLNFTLNSSVIFIPAALAGLFLLRKNDGSDQVGNFKKITGLLRNNINFNHLLLFNILIFIWAIIILLSFDNRNIIFFLLISLASCNITLQIFNADSIAKKYIILFEILVTSLSLSLSLTLKYSLYFGYTDTLAHLHFISTILSSGNLDGLGLQYENFPLFHIFISNSVLITGLPVESALFLIMPMVWLAGIGFIFLIARNLSNSTTFALIISLLFATSSQIIWYGSYTITRSLGFVFFLLILYLIFNKKENNKLSFTFILLLMTWVLILTHHVTLIYAIPIIILLYMAKYLIIKNGDIFLLSRTSIFLIVISFIAYLFMVSFKTTKSWIVQIITPIVEEAGPVGVTNSGNDYFIIIRNIYYIISIFFALIGIWSILDQHKKDQYTMQIFALSSILFLPLFIPTLLDAIPGSDKFLLYRLPLLATPFVVIVIGYGLLYFAVGNKSLIKASVHPLIIIVTILIIVSFSSFFAMTGYARDISFPWNQGTGSDFFNDQETMAYNQINSYVDHSQIIYSDVVSVSNKYQLYGFSNLTSLMSGNLSNIDDGYLIFRSGELESKGLLTFSINAVTQYSYKLDYNNPQDNIIIQLALQNRIYDDGAIQYYLIRN